MEKKGKIIYVTLKKSGEHVVRYFNYSDTFLYNYLGGRGFNIKILSWTTQNLPKTYDDKHNMVCISPGLLSGTCFPSSGRTSVAVLKSPITGFWGEGNFGGYFGPAMKLCGADSLIIDGKAPHPIAIHITEECRVKFIDCTTMWRFGAEATTAVLERHKNENYTRSPRKVLCIGQAGANEVFSSVVLCDNRTSGGGGTGAVFGSKNLKAIVVDNPKRFIDSYDPEYMKELSEKVEEQIKAHPVYNTFSTYGTTSLVEIHSGLKYFPTKNWLQKTWSKWKNISGKALRRDFKERDSNFEKLEEELKDRERLGCKNCPITCSNTGKIEYETLNCLGSKLGIDDLSWIQSANIVFFNDAGLDVIQTTSVISALMEMTEKGIVKSDLKFGDISSVDKFLDEMIGNPHTTNSKSLGAIFRKGFKSGMQELSERGRVNSTYTVNALMEEFFPHVKGMGLSGVFPSDKNRGSALAIATSSRGADHLRSLPTLATYADWYLGGGAGRFKKILKLFTIPLRSLLLMKSDTKNLIGDLYETYRTTFGVPAPIVDKWEKTGFLLDSNVTEGWGSMIKFCQSIYSVSDSMGTCRFISPWRFGIGPEIMANAFTYFTGISISWKELLEVGDRIYALEKSFSHNYGIPIKDSLPKRFLGSTDGKLREVTFSEMKEDYYKECGYDSNGIPTENLMKNLLEGTLEIADVQMLNAITFDRKNRYAL